MRTNSSPLPLYTIEQLRTCKDYATTHLCVSEDTMMYNAGKAAFALLKKHWPEAQKILVYCGSGNNAGDGYVLAKLAHKAGFTVIINECKPHEQLPSIAQKKALEAMDTGLIVHTMEDMADIEADVIVDALLGTGLKGLVKEPFITAINQMNDSNLPILSLDIPSGLDANTGAKRGIAVKASVTLSFIGLKQGFFTLDGPDHCGKIINNSIHLDSCLSQLQPNATTIMPSKLPKRARNSHKGDFGHVLIIGGNKGMPGALCLAAKAALRVGAGAVTVATHPVYENFASTLIPEAMIYGLHDTDSLDALLKKASLCLIGPGLGTDAWAQSLFSKVIASPLPMVMDASALRLLAEQPQYDDNWVLTPHPGEAAVLMGCLTQDIQADRFNAVMTLQQQYGGNIVLKGTGTLIRTDEAKTYLCQAGNSGMATAGMGDILSGVIAGLAAQKISLAEATCLGVYLHSKAADLACLEEGERGLIASDLFPYLRYLVNQ